MTANQGRRPLRVQSSIGGEMNDRNPTFCRPILEKHHLFEASKMKTSSRKSGPSKGQKGKANVGVAENEARVTQERKKLLAAFERQISLRKKKESIRPELRKYVVEGGILKHPLLVTLVDVEHAAWENWAIGHNQRILNRLRKEGKWQDVMSMYQTAFVLHGFCEELKHFDDATYWEMLGYVWTEQESSWPDRDLYLSLFQSPRPRREKLMEEEEHKAFARLPDTVNVYRGYMGCRGRSLSWTTDKDKAIWFANRFAVLKDELGPPRLLSGVANKSDILGYFTRRNESDAVIDPAKVRQQVKTEL